MKKKYLVATFFLTLLLVFGSVTSRAQNNSLIVTSGTGIPYIHDSTFEFGQVNVGDSRSERFTVTNQSYTTIQIYSTSLYKTNDYETTSLSVTLGKYQSANFTVNFMPTSQGTKTTYLSIFNDSSPNPYVINFTGEGVDGGGGGEYPLIVYDNTQTVIPNGGTYNFGTVTDPPLSQNFHLANSGYATLNIVSIDITDLNNFFSVSNVPTSIGGLDIEPFTIHFSPTADGQYNGSVWIEYIYQNQYGHFVRVYYNFTVVAEASGLDYSNIQVLKAGTNEEIIDGGGWDLGTTTMETIPFSFLIKNTGYVPLNLTQTPPVIISGTNAGKVNILTQSFPASINPGETLQIDAELDPASVCNKIALIEIYNDSRHHSPVFSFNILAIVSTPILRLEQGGTAIPHQGSFGFGSEGAGSTKEVTFTIHNDGNETLNISNPVVNSGLNEFWLSQNPDKTSLLDGKDSILFKISFTPLGRGTRSATVTIPNNGLSNPYTFTVTGQPSSTSTASLTFDYKGWYTLGSTVMQCDPSASPAANMADNYFPHYYFDGTGTLTCAIAASFSQTSGYWVYARGACNFSAQAEYTPPVLMKPTPQIAATEQLSPPSMPTLDMLTSMAVEKDKLPEKFQVFQNFPNPFNPTTKIRYNITKPSHVTINIYNTRGEKVITLIDQPHTAGRHAVVWDGTNGSGNIVAAGVYLVRVVNGQNIQTIKTIFVK